MTYAYAIALLIAPGALLASTPLCGTLGRCRRIGVAFALSPFVLAVELVIASVCGLTFATFLQLIVPFNLIGLAGLAGSLRRLRIGWPETLVALGLMVPVLILLLAVPYLREYGWHAMMQLAVLQQIWHLPLIPEEMDLAGLRLNYGWLGYAQLAVISAVLERPATLLFPWLNLLHFVCMFGFVVAAAGPDDDESGLGRRWQTSLVTAIILFSTVFLPFAATAIPTDGPMPGEGRITPIFAKYLFLDSMIYGLTCLALLVCAISYAFHRHDKSVLPLIPLAALACGICYPLLFPACVVAMACSAAVMLAGAMSKSAALPHFPVRSVAGFTIGSVLAVLAMGAYLMFLRADSVGLAIHRAQSFEVARHVQATFLAFGVTAVLLVWIAGHLWRRGRLHTLLDLRSPGSLNLVIAGLLVLCFGVLSMPAAVEYKFMFGALLFVTPYVVRCSRVVIGQQPGWLVALAATLVVLDATWIDREDIPFTLANAVPLDESRALVNPLHGWQGSWAQAVRDDTPVDTVLLSGASQHALSVFTDRAMYVAVDSVKGLQELPQAHLGRTGYSMSGSVILEDVKGYSPTLIAERRELLRLSLLAEAPLSELNAAITALARLRRPVAIHFQSESAFEARLRAIGVGRPIYESGPDTVWLIRPEEFPPANEEDSSSRLPHR